MRKKDKSIMHYIVMGLLCVFPLLMVGISSLSPQENEEVQVNYKYETNDINSFEDLIVGNIYSINFSTYVDYINNHEVYSQGEYIFISTQYFNFHNAFDDLGGSGCDYTWSFYENFSYFGELYLSINNDIENVFGNYGKDWSVLSNCYGCFGYGYYMNVFDSIDNSRLFCNISNYQVTSSFDNYVIDFVFDSFMYDYYDTIDDNAFYCMIDGESSSLFTLFGFSKCENIPLEGVELVKHESVATTMLSWCDTFVNLPINTWYKSLLDIIGLGYPNNIMSIVYIYPLYLIWVIIFDLVYDFLVFIPKLAHKWLEKGFEE